MSERELRQRQANRAAGFDRLNSITQWVIGLSLGLVGIFALVAATTIPGKSTDPGSTTADSVSSDQSTSDDSSNQSSQDDGGGGYTQPQNGGGFQRGGGGFFGSSGQAPLARSGGS